MQAPLELGPLGLEAVEVQLQRLDLRSDVGYLSVSYDEHLPSSGKSYE